MRLILFVTLLDLLFVVRSGPVARYGPIPVAPALFTTTLRTFTFSPRTLPLYDFPSPHVDFVRSFPLSFAFTLIAFLTRFRGTLPAHDSPPLSPHLTTTFITPTAPAAHTYTFYLPLGYAHDFACFHAFSFPYGGVLESFTGDVTPCCLCTLPHLFTLRLQRLPPPLRYHHCTPALSCTHTHHRTPYLFVRYPAGMKADFLPHTFTTDVTRCHSLHVVPW